jgi:hypothetical protein
MPRKPSVKVAPPPQPYHPPLVISIHGIRTRGEWQKVLAAVLSGSPTKTEAFDYGHYGLARFVIPPFNSRMVDRFYDWYAATIKGSPGVDLDRHDRRPSLVAHSLGSWIAGTAMLQFEDVRFDKLILAGSILPRDFDWATLFARDQVAQVRNECGQRDPWPGWAGRVVARTGTGGSEGFEWFGSAVQNVRSEWFGHSDALMRPHIERLWVPVLRQTPSPLALRHGRDIHDGPEFAGILDHTGTVIDTAAYAALPHYEDVEIPRGLSLTWIRVNADIYTFLIDRGTKKPAGYLNAMPVDDRTYAGIRAGRIADNEVRADGVRPYLGSGTVKIYLMSIAIDDKYRRWGEGIFQQAYVQLLTGFLDELTYYWKNHGVRVTHFLATAWTPEGRRMCESFGMQEIGKDAFGDAVFELDLGALQENPAPTVTPVIRRLLKAYE